MNKRFSDRFFLTITAGNPGKTVDRVTRRRGGYSKEFVFEFEFRFADGTVAIIRNKHGKGQVYVVGFFPGLEYRAAVRRTDFNMRRDFDAALRLIVAAPALELTRPVVEPSDPLVEGVLLKNAKNGMRAVTLANWAYGVTAFREDSRGSRSAVVAHLPVKDLKIKIQGGDFFHTQCSVVDASVINQAGEETGVIIFECRHSSGPYC